MKRVRNALIAICLTCTLASAADRDHVKRLGEKLICTCSCNQLLSGCNMIGCPNSGPMRGELAQMIDEGKSDDAILVSFVDKYGTVVLSAPTTSGFNLTAWITPFAALLVGLFVVISIVRAWRAQTPAATTEHRVDAEVQNRIEEELKKFTPED